MKFCESCQNRLEGSTMNGKIEFICKDCGINYPGEPSDTLIAEGILESTESNLKYEDLLYNTTSDPAGKRVKIGCNVCKLDFMYLVRLGVNNTVIYKCKCGNTLTHAQYEKKLEMEK